LKRVVNGEEVELSEEPIRVTRLPDRMLVHTDEGTYSAVTVRQGDALLVSYKGRQYKVEPVRQKRSGGGAASSGEMRAPMPGTVVAVHAAEGDTVKAGFTVLVLEAMKTQQPFVAPFDATIEKLPVSVGEAVSDGALLAFLTPATDTENRVSE
jgi:biotin carboxyl carrier protein